MNRIEIERGQIVTVEVTTEGKVFISIKDLDSNNLSENNNVINGECEGDYKGEQLRKVKMVKSEIDSLESSLGSSCLKYWIISLNSFADSEPAKFKKYKSHRACIQNWNRMRLEKGMVFSHIHPSGPGYYYRKEIESLKPEQLKLR